MSLHTLPVGELREKLDSGALSAVELAQSFLARIESSTLNAFIDVRPISRLRRRALPMRGWPPASAVRCWASRSPTRTSS